MKKILTKLGLGLISIFLFAFSLVESVKGSNYSTWGPNPPGGVPIDVEGDVSDLVFYVFKFFVIIALLPILLFVYLKFIGKKKIGNFLKTVFKMITVIFLWFFIFIIYSVMISGGGGGDEFMNSFSIYLLMLVIVLLYIVSSYISDVYKNKKDGSKIII